MQSDPGWIGERSKGHMVQNLLLLILAGKTATVDTSAAASQQSQGGALAHPSGSNPPTATPEAAGSSTDSITPSRKEGLPMSVVELGECGRRLLVLICALCDACEESGMYSESAGQRTREMQYNDRFQLDKALLDCMVSTSTAPCVSDSVLTQGNLRLCAVLVIHRAMHICVRA